MKIENEYIVKTLSIYSSEETMCWLIKESQNDLAITLALQLLVKMSIEIKDKRKWAIVDFRYEYLERTAGGFFETIIRDAFCEIYSAIAKEHGLENVADEYWK